jgi:hypothetical protein
MSSTTEAGDQREHHRERHRPPEVHRPGQPERAVDRDGDGRVRRAGDEDRRAELADGDGEREAGRDESRARHDGEVDLAPDAPRWRAERRRRLAEALVDGAQDRQHGPHDERDRDERLGERDEQDRTASGEWTRSEREQQAEAERHRGRPERQHEGAVHQPPGASALDRRERRERPDDERDGVAAAAITSEFRTSPGATLRTASRVGAPSER